MAPWDRYRKQYANVMAGHGGGAAVVLRAALGVAEAGYRQLIRARNARYDRSAVRASAAVPVISVGNITTGGTGKTPLVIWLVQRLLDLEKRPAVIARGYGGGRGLSDELQLIELRCPRAVAHADPDRIAGARHVVERCGADVIVLDDGFQHRRMPRDLDIVTIDALCPFGFDHILPRGLLREPVESLARADVVAVTRADQVDAGALARLRVRLQELAAGTPIVLCRHRPGPLVRLAPGGWLPYEPRPRRPIWMAGIGNPSAFAGTLRQLGLSAVGCVEFPDHHAYRSRDIDELRRFVEAYEGDALITTEKDAVKLAGRMPSNLQSSGWLERFPCPVLALPVDIEFLDDGEAVVSQEMARTLDRASRGEAGRTDDNGLA